MTIDKFSIDAFRSVIYESNLYFEEKAVGEKSGEIVFDARLDEIVDTDVYIRVYSSVRSDTEVAREEGSDAIRVHYIDKYGNTLALVGNERYKHIKRSDGWKERLEERIKKYNRQFPDILEKCDMCQRPMKVKSGFLGCTGWSPEDSDCQSPHE